MVDESIKCPMTRNWDPYDPEFRENPFPTYKEFRQKCPVGHAETYDGFWAVSRYEDVFNVARDSENYTSRQGISLVPLPTDGRALPMESDPPEHHALRMILMGEFTPNAVAAREGMVRKTAQSLIESFCEKGEADLSEDYSKLLPTAIVCALLGIKELDPKFQTWAEEIIYDPNDEERVRAASQAIYDFFKEMLPKQKKNPGDDFMGILIKAEVDGKPLDDQMILDFCWFLLIAGLDNTAFTIRNLFLQMDQNAWLKEELINHPEKIPDAIEETLRLYSPVWGITRTVAKDVELNGEKIPEGDRVLMLFASADRDEEEFPEPDKFILGRSPNRHMAFGMGRHRCLGAHLARLEIRVAVEEILKHLPDYKVTEEVGWNEMGPLPVSFEPRTLDFGDNS